MSKKFAKKWKKRASFWGKVKGERKKEKLKVERKKEISKKDQAVQKRTMLCGKGAGCAEKEQVVWGQKRTRLCGERDSCIAWSFFENHEKKMNGKSREQIVKAVNISEIFVHILKIM